MCRLGKANGITNATTWGRRLQKPTRSGYGNVPHDILSEILCYGSVQSLEIMSTTEGEMGKNQPWIYDGACKQSWIKGRGVRAKNDGVPSPQFKRSLMKCWHETYFDIYGVGIIGDRRIWRDLKCGLRMATPKRTRGHERQCYGICVFCASLVSVHCIKLFRRSPALYMSNEPVDFPQFLWLEAGHESLPDTYMNPWVILGNSLQLYIPYIYWLILGWLVNSPAPPPSPVSLLERRGTKPFRRSRDMPSGRFPYAYQVQTDFWGLLRHFVKNLSPYVQRSCWKGYK